MNKSLDPAKKKIHGSNFLDNKENLKKVAFNLAKPNIMSNKTCQQLMHFSTIKTNPTLN